MSCWSTVNGACYCVVVLLNSLAWLECFSTRLKCLQLGNNLTNGQQTPAATDAPHAPTLIIERNEQQYEKCDHCCGQWLPLVVVGGGHFQLKRQEMFSHNWTRASSVWVCVNATREKPLYKALLSETWTRLREIWARCHMYHICAVQYPARGLRSGLHPSSGCQRPCFRIRRRNVTICGDTRGRRTTRRAQSSAPSPRCATPKEKAFVALHSLGNDPVTILAEWTEH